MKIRLKKLIVFIIVFAMMIGVGLTAFASVVATSNADEVETEKPDAVDALDDPAEPNDPEDPKDPADEVEIDEPIPEDVLNPEDNPVDPNAPVDSDVPVDPEIPVIPEVPLPEYFEYTIKHYFTVDGEEVERKITAEVEALDNKVTLDDIEAPDDLPEGYVIDKELSTDFPFKVTEDDNVIEIYYVGPKAEMLKYTIYYSYETLDGESVEVVEGKMEAEVSSIDPIVTAEDIARPDDLPRGYAIDEELSDLPYEVTKDDNEIYVVYVPPLMMFAITAGTIDAQNYSEATGTSTNGHYRAIGVYIDYNNDVHILINELGGGEQYRFLWGTINGVNFMKTLDGSQNLALKTNPISLGTSATINLPDGSTVNATSNYHIWDFNIGPMVSNLQATNNLFIKNQAGGYDIEMIGAGSFEIEPDHSISKDVDKPLATIGDELIYTIEVSNIGVLKITGVNVYDDVPDGLTIIGVSEDNINWDDNPVYTAGGAIILGTGLTLNVGASKTYYIKAIVNVDAYNGQKIKNTAYTGGDVPRKQDTATVEIYLDQTVNVTVKKLITAYL